MPIIFTQVESRLSYNKYILHILKISFFIRYAEASSIFTEMLQLIPPGNHQIKREVTEGLARSLMKEGDLEQALTMAKLFVIQLNSKK